MAGVRLFRGYILDVFSAKNGLFHNRKLVNLDIRVWKSFCMEISFKSTRWVWKVGFHFGIKKVFGGKWGLDARNDGGPV